jgi:DegV family protein with EDD domain
MEKIGLITDEAADLSKEIIEKYDIGIVPVKLNWPEIENLPGENTFQKMRELEKRGIKSFAKTSQPSPKDFIDKYREKLQKYEKVICITLTSKHSGTFNSAIQGRNFLSAEEQERVFIIDSWQCSAGQAIFVLKTIDLIKEGKSTKEIVEELEKFRSKIKLFVMFEDPKWLENSGRISPLVGKFLRTLAQKGIRTFLTFRKGKLIPGGIRMQAKDTVLVFFNQFEKENRAIKNTDKKIKVVITHGDDFSSAQRLKEMIEKEYQNAKVEFVNIINNIVGAITGPNTLVIAWAEF